MSNLPPGVSEGMIPGNRPEDVAYEAKWNRLYEMWLKAEIHTDYLDSDEESRFDVVCETDWFIKAVDIAMELAYTQGWKDHQDEVDLEKAQNKWDADVDEFNAPGEAFNKQERHGNG